ncbi:MAG: hypothetical protein OHK0039_48950 [Bacteroidia bacterium]
MINDKPEGFLTRAVEMMCTWENEEVPPSLVAHLHGDKDRTLPIRRISDPIVIPGGSHMLVLTRTPEIGDIVNPLLRGSL